MLNYNATDSGATERPQEHNIASRYPWFKGVEIPSEVWNDSALTTFEKCLVSFLRSYPFATSHEVADLCGTTRSAIASAMSELRNKGFEISRTKLNPVNVVEALKNGDLLRDPLICEWCNGLVHSLHEHHFPVPKRNGGKDVVRICGSCHSDFHSLTGE